MDLDYIRNHYKTLDDSKIESLATIESRGLREEVIPILIEEIKRRNLSETILQGLVAQTRSLSKEEIAEYCMFLQKQDCPKCGSKTAKLNAGIINEVFSAVFITRKTKKLKIACPACLDEFKNNANSRNLLLGWWGLPWGPIYTIQSLITNSKMSRQVHTGEPNEVFKSFVYENIGALEAGKEDKQKIKSLIEYTNRQ